MNKPLINIFDRNFINDQPCSIYGKNEGAKTFNYIKNQLEWHGLTLFTDHCYDMIPKVKSSFKIAWQVESPFLSDKTFYPMLEKYQEQLDLILTYDQALIDSNPNKFKPVNFGGISVHNIKLYDKSKNVCIVHSGKNITANHRLRTQIISKYNKRGQIDVYGKVTGNPFTYIEDVYAPYRFAIIIENGNHDHYFTEKITDAFACGCIPIYNGCVNIDDYFDIAGIIKFRTLEDLGNILPTLNDKLYEKMLPAAEINLQTVKEHYWTNEDWLWNTYLKKIKCEKN